MDSEIVYAIFGIIGLSIIAYKTLNSSAAAGRTKEEVREDMIVKYKNTLMKSLKGYDKEDTLRKDKKIMILREFNEELARSIHFDKEDIREIMMELSGE